jgi:hypothetical protein
LGGEKMNSVLEEIYSFNEFFKKIPKLNTKRLQLENKLRELVEALKPFSSKVHEIPFRNGVIIVTRKHLKILEHDQMPSTITDFNFYRLLKDVPDEAILALDKYVNRCLRGYLSEYLLKARELKTEFVYSKEVGFRSMELFHYYDDEPAKITFDTVELVGTEVRLLEKGKDDLQHFGLICYPFKFTIQRTLNAILIREQFPEMFTIYDELLEQYNQDLDYNFKIVKEMEQIIRPFLLAREFGRNERKNYTSI